VALVAVKDTCPTAAMLLASGAYVALVPVKDTCPTAAMLLASGYCVFYISF